MKREIRVVGLGGMWCKKRKVVRKNGQGGHKRVVICMSGNGHARGVKRENMVTRWKYENTGR